MDFERHVILFGDEFLANECMRDIADHAAADHITTGLDASGFVELTLRPRAMTFDTAPGLHTAPADKIEPLRFSSFAA